MIITYSAYRRRITDRILFIFRLGEADRETPPANVVLYEYTLQHMIIVLYQGRKAGI